MTGAEEVEVEELMSRQEKTRVEWGVGLAWRPQQDELAAALLNVSHGQQ